MANTITWDNLDTNLQTLINKKLDKLEINDSDKNKNVVYANNENGSTIGINYGSEINIENRIVQVDANGNILVPDIVDSGNNEFAVNKAYCKAKVDALDTVIKDSMPTITVVGDVLTIETKIN